MRLEKFLQKLNKVPFINSGGCGWAAYCIYHFLKDNGGLAPDFKIVYLHDWFDIMDQTYEYNLKNKNKKACDHIIVLNNGKYFDSERKCSKKELDISNPVYGDIEGLISALKEEGWNPMFQIDSLIPFMEQYNIPQPFQLVL